MRLGDRLRRDVGTWMVPEPVGHVLGLDPGVMSTQGLQHAGDPTPFFEHPSNTLAQLKRNLVTVPPGIPGPRDEVMDTVAKFCYSRQQIIPTWLPSVDFLVRLGD